MIGQAGRARRKRPQMRTHQEAGVKRGTLTLPHHDWFWKGLPCPASYPLVNQRLCGAERAKSDQLFPPALSL